LGGRSSPRSGLSATDGSPADVRLPRATARDGGLHDHVERRSSTVFLSPSSTLGEVRRWVIVSAGFAPVALIGGWSLAAARQPPSYDPVQDTISALAEHGATDRWVMTTGLAVLGVCHLATAAGLFEAHVGGRVLLAVGGAATAVVAALPQPTAGHVPAATVGFVALALWPVAARVPAPYVAVTATAVLLALLGWLAVELRRGELLGLTERVLAGAEALWPLIVTLTLLRRRRLAPPARTNIG
jgi:hypothetical membrane protein